MRQGQSLEVIICGAGIAGLCAGIALAKSGHKITILESHELSHIGVGIHVPPNATLVLKHWGVLERFQDVAVVSTGMFYRRYFDGTLLRAYLPKMSDGTEDQPPYWTIRRSDYQRVLYDIAVEAGVVVRLRSKVVALDENQPSVTLEDGEELRADLIVAADGIKSKLRQFMFPDEEVSPILQPLESYRGYVPIELLADDPSTKSFFASPAGHLWLGPNKHIIVYPAESGKILAVIGTLPTRNYSAAAEWSKAADLSKIQHSFRAFDPMVRSILSETKDLKAWTLAEVPRLTSWSSASGKVVLMGDAAHGMLQFLAQGAAMATEDAAALANCIDRMQSADDIPKATKVYERSRKGRCERVQAGSKRNGIFCHVPDGEEQESRDRRLLGEPLLPGDEEADIGPMLDPQYGRWLYGHDVVAHTRKFLDDAGMP